MTIEVLIPVRNPTEVFSKTIDSLTAQTDKNFSVLISDNFSTKGAEQIESALRKLSDAKISARKIQPPSELGRIEHWNWLHQQSQADWLKPLFAGDWLEQAYISTIRETAKREPTCGYIYCGCQLHRGSETMIVSPQLERFLPSNEALSRNVFFGPPGAAIYRRDLFLALGGYDPSLPACADILFFRTLAAVGCAFSLKQSLCQCRSDRLADHSASAGEILYERVTYHFLIAYYAWTEKVMISKIGFVRLLAGEVYKRWFAR